MGDEREGVEKIRRERTGGRKKKSEEGGLEGNDKREEGGSEKEEERKSGERGRKVAVVDGCWCQGQH